MKKLFSGAKARALGVNFCMSMLLLSAATMFAAQQPNRPPREGERFTVQEIMDRLEDTIRDLDQPETVRDQLRSRLTRLAKESRSGKVDYVDAIVELNAVRSKFEQAGSRAGGQQEGEEKESEEKMGAEKKKKSTVKTDMETVIVDFLRKHAIDLRQKDVAPPGQPVQRGLSEYAQRGLLEEMGAQIAEFMPVPWNIQFKQGEESRLLDPKTKFGHLRVSADGRYVALDHSLELGTMEIVFWDMLNMAWDDSKSYVVIVGAFPRFVWNISPKGDLLAYQLKKDIVIVDLKKLEDVWRIQTDAVENLTFSLDGQALTGYSMAAGVAQTWSVATGKAMGSRNFKSLPDRVKNLAQDPGGHIAFSARGDRLAAIFGDTNTIEIWDLNTNALMRTFEQKERKLAVASCVLDSEGNKVAVVTTTGGWKNSQMFMSIWNVATGNLECDIPIPQRTTMTFLHRIAFSPDGLCLATTFDGYGYFRVWNVPELQRRYSLQSQQVGRLSVGQQASPIPRGVSAADGGEPEEKERVEAGGQAAVPISSAGPAKAEPVKMITVQEFLDSIESEGLMNERELDKVRELFAAYTGTKISEADARKLVDDVIRAGAPRELEEQGEAKEVAAAAPPGISRRITIAQAREEFRGRELPTERQREIWEKELTKLAAQSVDLKIKYEDAWQLFEEIKSMATY